MIAALIIAVGKNAHRYGFSPQKKVGDISAIQRIVMLFQRACIENIVVVCDENDDETEKLASHRNVVFLHNHKDAEKLEIWTEFMYSRIATLVKAVRMVFGLDAMTLRQRGL